MVKVFRIVAYLNTIRYPVNLFGQALKFMTDAFVSVERLDSFFRLPILEGSNNEAEKSAGGFKSALNKYRRYRHGKCVDFGRIKLDGASFSWGFSEHSHAEPRLPSGYHAMSAGVSDQKGDPEWIEAVDRRGVEITTEASKRRSASSAFSLHGLTLTTEPGDLIAVIGSVGPYYPSWNLCIKLFI